MNKLLRLLPLVFWLAACTGGAGKDSIASKTPIQQNSGTFTLTITSPADLAIVTQSPIDLKGKVNETAVLTVNDDTYLVQKGAFTEPVQLEEGANTIQIVASDMDGNEVDMILSITYQP